MKRIILSAAAIMLIISGTFAGTNKEKSTSTTSNRKLQQVFKEFPGLSTTIPSSVEVQKNLSVEIYKDDDENETTDFYKVSLAGKHYNEEAVYDRNGMLVSYKDKLTDKSMPHAIAVAIQEKHPAAVITKDKEIIKDSKGAKKDEYKVYFKDGKKHYKALAEPDGTIDRMHRHLL
ncbi:MAG: hypothetical protein ABI861_04175 [Panacibacter sp.]